MDCFFGIIVFGVSMRRVTEQFITGRESGRIFRKEKQLKVGKYGKIFATSENGQDYALKIPNPRDNFFNGEILEGEAEIQSRFSHPNITPVVLFDYSQPEGIPFLVTPRAPYSLREYVAYMPLTGEQAFCISEETASAVATINGEGYLHRDIKAANVLIHVDTDGFLRSELTDFGLAATHFENFKDSVVYKVKSVPPEAAYNKYYRQTEQFRWAMEVVYPAAVGSNKRTDKPFLLERRRPTGVLPARRSISSLIAPERRSIYIDVLDEVTERALQADPRNRYTNMEALHVDLVEKGYKAEEERAKDRVYV